MLPYHIITPQKRFQPQSQFIHYLSLGSNYSSVELNHIISFSIIKLSPKTHLPKISLEDIKKQYSDEKIFNLVVPLYGEFMVNGKEIKNMLMNQQDNITESDINGNKQASKMKKIHKIEKVNYVQDVQYITNKADKDKYSICLYMIIKAPSSSQNNNVSGDSTHHLTHSSRFITQNKSLIHYPIPLHTPQVEISFLQCFHTTQIPLHANQLLYLQKGKATFQQIQIKNKGNQKDNIIILIIQCILLKMYKKYQQNKEVLPQLSHKRINKTIQLDNEYMKIFSHIHK